MLSVPRIVKISFNFTNILKGDELISFLEKQKTSRLADFERFMGEMEPETLITQWRNLQQAIDEFLNFPYELSPHAVDMFKQTSLVEILPGNTEYHQLSMELENAFGKETKDRFEQLFGNLYEYQQDRVSSAAFGGSPFPDMDHPFNDLNDVFNYFSSIRIYLSAMEGLISKHCHGTVQLPNENLLIEFLPRIDNILSPMAAIYFMLLTNACMEGYELHVDRKIVKGNKYTSNLDTGFFDPTMVSLFEQLRYRVNEANLTAWVKPESVFSFPELIAQIDLMETAFGEYKITSFDEFWQIKSLLRSLALYCLNNYSMTISEPEFKVIQRTHPLLNLLNKEACLPDTLYDFSPFRIHDGNYYTTIPLLIRHTDRLLTSVLNKVKRFQIHAGYTFEKKVKDTLTPYGFEFKDIKRLANAEFDVIMELDGEIHNFQCKNNMIDTYSVNQNMTAIARKNAILVKRYRKALQKEHNRQHLLQKQFPGQKITHYVVSRFPVLHEVDQLINYNSLDSWAASKGLIKEEPEDILASITQMIDKVEAELQRRNHGNSLTSQEN